MDKADKRAKSIIIFPILSCFLYVKDPVASFETHKKNLMTRRIHYSMPLASWLSRIKMWPDWSFYQLFWFFLGGSQLWLITSNSMRGSSCPVPRRMHALLYTPYTPWLTETYEVWFNACRQIYRLDIFRRTLPIPSTVRRKLTAATVPPLFFCVSVSDVSRPPRGPLVRIQPVNQVIVVTTRKDLHY
jgi:hypothetical protein